MGIDGTHYVHKVILTQFMTVVLQATSKLNTMAMVASMRGSVDPNKAFFDPLLVPLYWVLFVSLLFNTVYPSVLLSSPSARIQRDAASSCDATLDLVYFFVFMLSTFSTASYAVLFPVLPYDYLGTFYPLLHVHGVAHALDLDEVV